MKRRLPPLTMMGRASVLATLFSVFFGASAWAGVGGSLDAVFSNISNERNRVCLNDGLGTFICTDVSTDANQSAGVALGDVDGANGLDAVFANSANPPQRNRVCLNDGSGGFTCSDVSTDANESQAVALGDVDGVNGLDAVFANAGDPPQGNRVCLNNGSGNFTCSDVDTDTYMSGGVALGDVEGANGLDVVFLNNNQRHRVCLNNGSGSFTCSDVGADTFSTFSVALGDVDGVNGPDAVFADSNKSHRVCLNDGLGNFTCSDFGADPNHGRGVALGDVDGVNGLDVIVANSGAPDRVCLNDGSGNFTCSDLNADTNDTFSVALGDLTAGDDGVPALSLRGSLIALLLLFVGAAVAGLSRRRWRRVW